MRVNNNDVCARITLTDYGRTKIEIQRAKYKHWYELGAHKPTDNAFEEALRVGAVVWFPKVKKEGQLL